MPAKVTNNSLGWFINTVLQGNLNDLIFKHKQYYLGFGVIANGIEFIGACIDNYPMDEQGHSKERFNNAILKLFDSKYHPYTNPSSPYNLYKHLRCGMAHIMRPQGKVAFTSLPESREDGTTHLTIHDKIDKLILISEEFYWDFNTACGKIEEYMQNNTCQKTLNDQYISITELQ